MSTLFALLADVSVLAFVSGETASVCSIETMADIRSFSRFPALSLMPFASSTRALSSNTVRGNDCFIVPCEGSSIGKENVLPLSNFVPDGCIVLEQFWVDGQRLRREKLFNVVAILPELLIPVGEQERCRFDDEVESCGPLATHFNFRSRFGSSKLYFSRSNTSDTFVNAVDVMERTEDRIDVN